MSAPPIRTKPSGWLVLVLASAAAGLSAAPDGATERIRTWIRDRARPAQAAARAAWTRATDRFEPSEPRRKSQHIAELETRLASANLRIRRLEVERGRMHDRLAALRDEARFPAASLGAPLFVPEFVEARILGREIAQRWRAGQLLDKGTADGVTESTLVLEADGPLIDQGATSQVAPGQFVLGGGTVLGKIARTGRYTSTLLPVTDRAFRGSAVIGRRTASGIHFQAAGVLEGGGQNLCRLTMIDAAEPVRVGDAVYSREFESTLKVPMYYGRIVRAVLPPGGSTWEIDVEPAAAKSRRPRTVQILRLNFNSVRLLAD